MYAVEPSLISRAVELLSEREISISVPSAEMLSRAMSPTLVMLPSETLSEVPTRAAKVPAAAELAPITVPSIAPLSTLMLVIAWSFASRAAPS